MKREISLAPLYSVRVPAVFFRVKRVRQVKPVRHRVCSVCLADLVRVKCRVRPGPADLPGGIVLKTAGESFGA